MSVKDLPLSLQEICYLYLVGHLDKYTPEILSLLPKLLRRQLLFRLPAIDLHQLENTPVTDDFDHDMSIYWKALLEYVKEVMYHPMNPSETRHPFCLAMGNCPFLEEKCYESDEADSKNVFLDGVALHIVLPQKAEAGVSQQPTDYSYPHAKLFCLPYQLPPQRKNRISSLYMKATLQASRLKYLCSSNSLMIPSRLESIYITEPWDNQSITCVLSLLRILVDIFDYRAAALPLDSSYDEFYRQNAALLERFLSQVEVIDVCGCSQFYGKQELIV